MRKIIAILFLLTVLFIASSSSAQKTRLQGSIWKSETSDGKGAVLIGKDVTVIAYKVTETDTTSDTTLVDTTLTSKTGIYRFDFEAGDVMYYLSVRYQEKESQKVGVFVVDGDKTYCNLLLYNEIKEKPYLRRK